MAFLNWDGLFHLVRKLQTEYIKDISLDGTKLTFTKGNNTQTELTTQDTHYTTRMSVTNSNTNLASVSASNGNVYLNIIDDSTIRNSANIIGTDGTTVTCDNKGKITINSHDTVYTHPDHTAYANGLYNIVVDDLGHISSATLVTKEQLVDGLDMPGQDTVYTHPTTTGYRHIPSGGESGQFLKWVDDGKATWANNPNTDTKNTAGSTNTSDKIFLVGATSQTSSPQTYSDDDVYTTDGDLHSKQLTINNGGIITYNNNALSTNVSTKVNGDMTATGTVYAKWPIYNLGKTTTPNFSSQLDGFYLWSGTLSCIGESIGDSWRIVKFGGIYVANSLTIARRVYYSTDATTWYPAYSSMYVIDLGSISTPNFAGRDDGIYIWTGTLAATGGNVNSTWRIIKAGGVYTATSKVDPRMVFNSVDASTWSSPYGGWHA